MHVSISSSADCSFGKTASDIARLSGDRPVLVLAPHPGDETLGCGMLLAAAFAGHGARIVALSRGADPTRPGACPTRSLASRRAAEVDAAVRALGGHSSDVERWEIPLGHVPTTGPVFERAVSWIEARCVSNGVRCLYASGPENAHVDHVATALIARGVAQRQPELRVLHYTLWPSSEDRDAASSADATTFRFAAERWRTRKRRAVRCHRSQLEELDADPRGAELRRVVTSALLDGEERFVEHHR